MITAKQMEVIARVEQYSEGMLYRWPRGLWSEISPLTPGATFSRFNNWWVRTGVVEDMLEDGLATVVAWHHDESLTYPIAVKIKAP